MQHLPDDILFEVFAILCADGYIVGDNSTAPWNLARVSRSWRQTALSYSSLWAEFLLSITQSTDLSRCSHLPFALDRSGTHPLTFSFFSYLPSSSDSDPLIVPALVALSREARRWKSAHFYLPTNLTAMLLVELNGRRPFDCLETIWLQKLKEESELHYDFSEKGVGVDLSTLFLDAPKLLDMMCDFDIPFQLPWTQLRVFRDDHITSIEMIPYIDSILRLSPQLKHFEAKKLANVEGTFTIPTTHSILHHLEHAHIDGFECLLPLLTMPSLRTLTVMSLGAAADDHVVPLIRRSECYDLAMLYVAKHGPIDVMYFIEEPKFTKLRYLLVVCAPCDPLAVFTALRDRASLPALETILLAGPAELHPGEDHFVGCFTLLRVILEVVQTRCALKLVHVSVESETCKGYYLQPLDRQMDTSGCLAKLEDQASNRGLELNIMFCAQIFLVLGDIPTQVFERLGINVLQHTS